jgi:nucleoside-diphosphate-sugar epimerase
VIFCSGVSNSTETRKSEFEREIDLLKKHLSVTYRFVYFSTISVVDGSYTTNYVEHKTAVERFISSSHNDFIIFRLPLVVGHEANKYTFFKNLSDKIYRGEDLEVRTVSRYLIDIDDVYSTLSKIISDPTIKNTTINVCVDNFTPVIDIITGMEKAIGVKCEKRIVETSPNHPVENKEFLRFFDGCTEGYNERLFSKYCKIKSYDN